MKKEVKKDEKLKSDLAREFDAIDDKLKEEGKGGFADERLARKHGNWRKGWAVIEKYPEAEKYGGKNKGGRPETGQLVTGFSWRMVAEETGRRNTSIKSWVQLAKKIKTGEENFKIWAEKERKVLLKNYNDKDFDKNKGETDWHRYFDIWNFAGRDERFGIVYPGNIPGQIVLNVLYYYAGKNALVVDPMAGGGVTIDCVDFLNKEECAHRKCLAYDINPVKERDDIQKNDILLGYPKEAKNCDLIFLDPPYSKKKEEEYGENSISALSRDKYLDSFNAIAKNSFDTIKSGGFLAFIMEPYVEWENAKDSIWVYDYILIFQKAGWIVERIIDVPTSTQRWRPEEFEKAKEIKRMLTLRRQLVIFKKEK